MPISRRPAPPGSCVSDAARRWPAITAALVGVGAAALLWLAPAALAQVSFSGPTNLPVGDWPAAIAVADFNGDSDPDLAVANNVSGTVSVLLGGAGGSFGPPAHFPAGASPSRIAVAISTATRTSTWRSRI